MIDEYYLIEYSAKMNTNPDLEQKMKGLSFEMRDYIKGLEQTVDVYGVELGRLIRENIELKEKLYNLETEAVNGHELIQEMLERHDS